MTLLKCLLTANKCYTSGKTIVPKGVMIHSTGANNPNLKRYIQPLNKDIPNAYDPDRKTLLAKLGTNVNHNDWNNPDIEKCVHAFIGRLADGTIATVQTLPWNRRGWHAGKGTSGKTANDTHISFEICESSLLDYNYFTKTKNEAVDLVAMLCKEYNLDPMADGVIICHQDGYKRGIASNHGDIYIWWNAHNYTMDMFRKEVYNKMHTPIDSVPKLALGDDDSMVYYKTKNDVPEYYLPTIEKLLASGALKGEGKGVLNVSEDFCRIFTVLDRLGKI